MAEGRPHLRLALVAPDRLPGFRAELERMLVAKLAVYEIDGVEPPAADAPALAEPVPLEPDLEPDVPEPPAWLSEAPPALDPLADFHVIDGPDLEIPFWLRTPIPPWCARAGP